VFVEVILMESAVLSVAVVAEVHAEVPLAPCRSRFSTGLEQRPEGPSMLRVGSFADGIEQTARG
jgi:hypothetical protein